MSNIIGAVLGTTTLMTILAGFFALNAMFWGGLL